MKKQYSFKKTNVRDLDEFFILFSKLTVELFPEYSLRVRNHILKKEYNIDAIKAQFKAKQIIIYLASCSKGFVGYLIVRPIVGGVCMGEWMAISEENQNMGVASGLLDMWQKDAKARGVHKLHLWADERNVQFYKNRGFVFVGKVPKNYYGVDDYFFYKSIQSPVEKNYLKK